MDNQAYLVRRLQAGDQVALFVLSDETASEAARKFSRWHINTRNFSQAHI